MRIKNYLNSFVSLKLLLLTTGSAYAQVLLDGSAASLRLAAVDHGGRAQRAAAPLNAFATAGSPAIDVALTNDPRFASALATVADTERLEPASRSMLPDHAGGAFDAVIGGSRALSHHLIDVGVPSPEEGKSGLWLDQAMWFSSKGTGRSGGYVVAGWGAAAGVERSTAFGTFGLSAAYGHGSDDDHANLTMVTADLYQGGLYWKGNWSRFSPFAALSYGHVDLSSARSFDTSRAGDGLLVANADWKGSLMSGTGGFSYLASVAGLSIRPRVQVSYDRLTEGGYSETGGGSELDLIVDRRDSHELTARGTVALGKRWTHENSWLSLEFEVGRRQVISGNLGDTAARVGGGQSFTLTAEKRTNGWIGALRGASGAYGFRVGGDLGAEQQFGRVAIAARAGVRIAF